MREQRLLARHWVREREIERTSIKPPFRPRRLEVDLAAVILFDGRAQPVRILNVTVRGAMIRGLHLPGSGERIAIKRGTFVRNGTVRWIKGACCGVQFDQIFQRKELEAFKLPLREDRRRTGSVLRLLGPRR